MSVGVTNFKQIAMLGYILPSKQRMDIVIRSGTREDLPIILDLVKELAEFEESADQVVIDLSYYEKSFDGGDFEVLVADCAGKVRGVAIYYLTYSTWRGRMLYLEDLIVEQEYRSRSIGKQLLDHFLQRAKELDCTVVKWQVLDWNDEAVSFYEKYGVSIEKNWWNVKLIF